MRIQVQTVDDALRQTYEAISRSGTDITSTRGTNRELIGVQIEITNPRARVSRTEARATLYSALGEFLWYLAQSDSIDFIKYYAPQYPKHVQLDGERVVAAYGPRLFNFRGIDQVKQVIELLKDRPSSRQAVIQLLDCSDLAAKNRDVPCTCTVQFLCRNGMIDAITTMRSNDSVRGLPHDVFAFTMLQEIVARSLSAEIGRYHHWVGSLHFYDRDREKVSDFIREGWQQTSGIAMGPMPVGDPWPEIQNLLRAEEAFRVERRADPWPEGNFQYWNDLIWLLEMRRHFSAPDKGRGLASWEGRKTKAFDVFLRPRVEKLRGVNE